MIKSTGIYSITNSITSEMYVGSSLNVHQRLVEHKRILRKNIHFNAHLQYSFNKYGINNFKFELIEECDPTIRLWIEQYWITILNAKFNIKSPVLNLAESKKIDVYDLSGNFIATYNSILETSSILNVNRGDITSVCTGKKDYVKGFVFKYSGDIFKEITIRDKEKLQHKSKLVDVYNLDGVFYETYNSVSTAARNCNVDASTVYKICNRKLNCIHGYIFRYSGEDLGVINLYTRKQVCKLSVHDEYLTTYVSIAEAAKINNCSSSEISRVIYGRRKTARGYKWRFKNN